MNTQRKTYAFFDFDGTITVKDTLIPFLYFAFPFSTFIINLFCLIPHAFLYLLRVIDNSQMKVYCLTRFIKGLSVKEFELKAKAFAESKIKYLVRPQALERIKWHQGQGHHVFLVSANLEIFLKHWSISEGIEQTIATMLEQDKQGLYTGKLMGRNCYGVEKVKRLKASVNFSDQDYIFAYGDSRGDKEMLEIADEAFFKPFRL
ncbi:MAG: HAD-IB family hydrolase [Chlamydiales bacterium]|nr:HAD-IB family hydrolase [Chlamydiales bacterium]